MYKDLFPRRESYAIEYLHIKHHSEIKMSLNTCLTH